MKNKICICFAVLLFLTALPVKADSIKDKLSQVGFNMLTKKDAKAKMAKKHQL